MSPSARVDVVALFLPMALVINVLSSWLDLVYLNLKGREQHTSYLFPPGPGALSTEQVWSKRLMGSQEDIVTLTPHPAALPSASRRPSELLGVGCRARGDVALLWVSQHPLAGGRGAAPHLCSGLLYLPTGQRRPLHKPGTQVVFHGRMKGSFWMPPSS